MSKKEPLAGVSTPAIFDPTNPNATGIGVDTPIKFLRRATSIAMQNKTAANVYFAFDKAATVGSFVVPAGMLLVLDYSCSVLHLFTAAAQNINGTVDNNIVIDAEIVE
jgi:hypothetical protein